MNLHAGGVRTRLVWLGSDDLFNLERRFSTKPGLRASMFRRSRGSVFEERMLKRQSSNSTSSRRLGLRCHGR